MSIRLVILDGFSTFVHDWSKSFVFLAT